MTAPLIEPFLSDAGWGGAARMPLAGDASARRYERLCKDQHTAVLMIAPVATQADRASLDAFLRVGAFLIRAGLSAPEVFADQPEQGLILMQDFGDLSLARLLDHGHATEAYAQAADIPYRLAEVGLPDWAATPNAAGQAAMVGLTFDQLPDADDLRRDTLARLQAALMHHADGRAVLSVRDFHADNLIWRPGQTGIARIGLLDFQDAVALPMGYDLASLVDDPRRDLPGALRADLIADFAARMSMPLEAAQARIDTLSLLRNLRILGIFHRLAERGNLGYRAFLPRTMRLVDKAVRNAALSDLRAPVSDLLSLVAGWAGGIRP